MAAKITYLHNPALPVIKPGYRGNKVINGEFANGEALYEPSFLDVLKWRLTANPQKEEKERDPFRLPVVHNPDLAEGPADRLVWLGHSSFFLCLAGVKILFDPVLYDLPMLERKAPLPCAPAALKGIDYLLLSHGHRDHLDQRSVQEICRQNPQAELLVPLQMQPLLNKWKLPNQVQEAGWYQRYEVQPEELEIYFLPASHWHRRGLTDLNRMLWGSFLVRTPRLSLYFAGDTAADSHFREIQTLFPQIDWCLLPVGAYRPDFLMSRSHTTPAEAAEAFRQLHGRFFVPMHYGTFDLSDEPPGEPAWLLRQIAAEGSLGGTLVMPAVGETVYL